MRPSCIKCNGEHATRDCNITEKIAEPTCINCGEKGHLAAWKGCKALPVITKPLERQQRKSYAQATTVQRQMIAKPRLWPQRPCASPPPSLLIDSLIFERGSVQVLLVNKMDREDPTTRKRRLARERFERWRARQSQESLNMMRAADNE
ncbi:hypothetical protein AVEN_203054-1 [Araneus ventricosus]|uniref:CCHC-type domain-containing protein n=1 Tax=Araneus ventricosus TaxID=182803 RepID=A0A4Y2G9V6_ARAVE|nr:hypothetical protein AVEN_203054-1 [Araneus ventricosus]